MKLFGHPDSGHAYKVKLFLAVAGIEHDYEEVDINAPRESRQPEFRTHSRYQEVPCLLDEGKALVQSNAILCHLAVKTGRYGAENDELYQRCLEWLYWEANKIGLCLPQLRGHHKSADSALTAGAHQWLSTRYQHDIELLDTEFSDSRQFINGNHPTIADFSLCGYLFHADEAQVDVPRHVRHWLDRIAALPGWKPPYDLLRT